MCCVMVEAHDAVLDKRYEHPRRVQTLLYRDRQPD